MAAHSRYCNPAVLAKAHFIDIAKVPVLPIADDFDQLSPTSTDAKPVVRTSNVCMVGCHTHAHTHCLSDPVFRLFFYSCL